MCIEAYAAALLDGEGHIRVQSGANFGLDIIFGMSDREPLDLLASKWGGNVLTPASQVTRTGRRMHRWIISGSYAIAFLEDVRPWVQGKAKQVELALKYPLTGSKGRRGNKLPLEVFEARRQIGSRLRELRAVR
ncbi:hypothetical protein LCGC14_2876780 [marine sediment metagenome]|uniref:Homing endonuclease LAGLIDADG domain-containing protein n=1 Tax=marine sediment metagenome TaxID=412755 RepID=A0A0F8YN16_9ZZZZ